MKPAREPVSSRPKPCVSLKKPHASCPFAAPCGPRRKKNDRGQRSVAFPQKPPGSRFRFSRTGVQPSLVNDRAALRLRPNLVRTHLIENSIRLSATVLPASRVPPPPESHQIGARKSRRTPENTIPSQPYCRRVSTDRPNREGSQLAASLEGEPGPTPAGKTIQCFL